MTEPTKTSTISAFTVFVTETEPRLRQALVARFGPDSGRDATAEALAYGWEHWAKVRAMANPAGYLFRVGQTHARRLRPRPLHLPPAPESGDPWVEPGLPAALENLSDKQRAVVLLIHSYAWTQREVAEILGVRTTTVQKHLERALAKLRTSLEVTDGS